MFPVGGKKIIIQTQNSYISSTFRYICVGFKSIMANSVLLFFQLDMPTEQIVANLKTIIEDICKFKPSSAGKQLFFLSTS